ncbi:MAG: serine hydrolase domain-containing protein [Planctomycetaceae bacterium]
MNSPAPTPHDELERLGIDRRAWFRATSFIEDLCRRDVIPAVGWIVGRGGEISSPHVCGRSRIAGNSDPIAPDAIFLIASITKPVVGTAVLQLVERGEILLGDKVTKYIPEFGKNGKYGVTVRHLLTHTSGLPDMLPNNRELREQQQPMSKFVEEICGVNPDFPPGRGVQYQSTGFGILGEIILRVTGRPCPDYLRDEIFQPLGMNDTALGAPPEWFAGPSPKVDRIAELRIPEEQQGTNWHWNTKYWRMLGAPWGGLLTTLADVARFAEMLRRGGELNGTRILSTQMLAAATMNQLTGFPDLKESDRRGRAWGYGWRLHWPGYSPNFGDLLSPYSYGHWGATGTVLWVDPAINGFAVVFTTQPQEPHGRELALMSNLLAAAWIS